MVDPKREIVEREGVSDRVKYSSSESRSNEFNLGILRMENVASVEQRENW